MTLLFIDTNILLDFYRQVGSIRVSQRYLGAFRSFSWVT